MPQYVVTVLVTVEAATPGAAVAWVHHELAARLAPDTGGRWHSKKAWCNGRWHQPHAGIRWGTDP